MGFLWATAACCHCGCQVANLNVCDGHVALQRVDVLCLVMLGCSRREFKKIILLGYKFAQRMDDQGAFERFDVSGVDKQSLLL